MGNNAESINDFLAELNTDNTPVELPDTEPIPTSPDTRLHPDAVKMRADIAYFSDHLMSALKKALQKNPGSVDLRKLSTTLPDGSVKQETGLALPLLLDEVGSSAGKNIFFVGTGLNGGEFVAAAVPDDQSTKQELSGTPLDLNALGLDSLYQLEGSMLMQAFSLDPDSQNFDSLKPTRATLTLAADGYVAETATGKKYRVPMVYVTRQRLEVDSEVAVLIPVADPDSPWAAADPIGYYAESALSTD